MKKLLIGFNIVLAIAVITLFFLYNNVEKKTLFKGEGSKHDSSFRIAYIEMDSVQNEYDYFKAVRNGLLSRQQDYARQLSGLEKALNDKYNSLQSKGSSMNQEEIAKGQQSLADLQSNLREKKQYFDQSLQEESVRKLQVVKNKIEDFLKEYNKQKKYAYILGNSDESFIYYKDSAYNITSEVIRGLNEAYRKKLK